MEIAKSQLLLYPRHPALKWQSMISLFPNLAPMDIYMLKVLEQMYYDVIQSRPSKKYHTSTTIELQAIEPNPTKSLISSMLQVSISKKKQRNFHKNKRKLKANILTRRHVSPGTASTNHDGGSRRGRDCEQSNSLFCGKIDQNKSS